MTASAGQQAEALDEPITAVWRDRKFTIDPPDRWLMRFQHWFDRDKITLAAEEMLGPKQYEEWMLESVPPPSITEMEPFFAQVFSKFGLDLGEAAASTS